MLGLTKLGMTHIEQPTKALGNAGAPGGTGISAYRFEAGERFAVLWRFQRVLRAFPRERLTLANADTIGHTGSRANPML